MKFMSGVLAVAFVVTTLGASVVSAMPRDVDSHRGVPLFTEVAAKSDRAQKLEAKKIEAKLNAAAKKLKDDPTFQAAVQKKDTKTVVSMLRKASGVNDVPMNITFGDVGSGDVGGKIKIIIRVRCCEPLEIEIEIRW